MPLLFIILGQRLGVDVTLSTAPEHLFVKFKTDDMGWINLEATSGANPARDVWIRKQFPSMTDQAVANGIYMQTLTRTETVAVIAEVLGETYMRRNQYQKAIALADVILEHYPKAVSMMIVKGSAYGRIGRQRYPKQINPAQVSPSDLAYAQYLAQQNRAWFAKAEALGWREETQEQEKQYLQRVNQAK